jgi:uncharacterized protein
MADPATRSRILWQRLDEPGHEWCELSPTPGGLSIAGVSLVVLDGSPHRIEYAVEVDADGRTRRVSVRSRGPDDGALELAADGLGVWTSGDQVTIDAREVPAALDVDLGFSPVTNSLPIRRLAPTLDIGESAAIRVAWVLYPGLDVVLGEQWYDRLDRRRWRYRSGAFAAELEVGEDGLVETYEGLFRLVARDGRAAHRSHNG